MNVKQKSLKQILEEIAKGEGAYSQDRLEHAGNCIENMKKLANEGLSTLREAEKECKQKLDDVYKFILGRCHECQVVYQNHGNPCDFLECDLIFIKKKVEELTKE